MDNFIVKHAHFKLSHLDNNEIVKVAGVLQRLKSWYKALMDPAYKSKVDELRLRSASVKVYLDAVSKYIALIDTSLKDGDVDAYNENLDSLRQSLEGLNKELAPTYDAAEEAKVEHKNEPNLEKIDRVYFSNKMRNSDYVKNILRKVFKQSGLEEDVIEKVVDQPALYDAMEQAISNGNILNSSVAKSKGRDRGGELQVDIQTKPFEIPGLPATIQFIATVIDMSFRSVSPRAQMAVKNLRNIIVRKTENQTVAARLDAIIKNAGEVKRVKMQVNQLEFAKLLIKGFSEMGVKPTAQLVGVTWAQAMLESGRSKPGPKGVVYLTNNNVGGLTAGNYDKEWLGAGKGWIESGKPYTQSEPVPPNPVGLKFKAYATPLDGIKGYIEMLSKKYPESMKWKAAGLPMHDAKYLRTRTYFGKVPAEPYGGQMDLMFKEFMEQIYPQIKDELPSEPAKPPKDPNEVAPGYTGKSASYGWNGSGGEEFSGVPGKFTPTEYKGEAAKSESTEAEPNMQQEIQNLAEYLGVKLATPLSDVVNNTLIDLLVPKSNVLIRVASNDDYDTKIEFADALCESLRRTIQADTTIHSDGNNIEISCTAAGKVWTLTEATNAISNVVSGAFMERYGNGIVVEGAVRPNKLSKLAEMDNNLIIKSKNKFFLKRV